MAEIIAEPPSGPAAAIPEMPAQVQVTGDTTTPVDVPEYDPKSAKGRLYAQLQKKAKVNPEGFNPPEKPAITPPPGETPPEETPGEGEEPAKPAEGEPGEKPAEAPPAAADPNKGKKPNKDFWKSFDEWKGRATKAEAKIQELQQQITPENDRTQLTQRMTELEKRNTELENHIRFVDYSQSTEFKEQYEKPYVSAWQRAINDLNEIKVTDGEHTRVATSQDLLALVQLPLSDARALAKTMFGDLADDVMAYRKEIVDLNRKQNEALQSAKENSKKIFEQKATQTQAQQTELNKFIGDHWQKFQQEPLNDPVYGEYFKPKDGDEEGNSRLAKGYAMADEAFKANPYDPNLTPQQRAAAIRRHAIVKHRAAAAGRLIYWNKQQQAKIAALEKQLADIKGTSPKGGAPTPAGGNGAPGPTTAMGRLEEELRKRAK